MGRPQSVLDALADAETLKRCRLGGQEFGAALTEIFTDGYRAILHIQYGFEEDACIDATLAARAAFRAVPGLRCCA